MKKDIHPKYYDNTKVTCACGNSFVTSSTQNEITTEICSVCHPFYTGKQKFVDTEGRIEKFEKKLKVAREKKKSVKKKAGAKKGQKEGSLTLKEMLDQTRKNS